MRPCDEDLPDVNWFLKCGTSCIPSTSASACLEEDSAARKCKSRDGRFIRASSIASISSCSTLASDRNTPSSTVLMTPPRTPEQSTPVSLIDYKVSPERPPLSYTQMITMALLAANGENVVLADIYAFVQENFAYYRFTNKSWRNSIRHNLSLNRAFEKVPRSEDDKGKGHYWALAKCEEEAPQQPVVVKGPKKAVKVNPAVVRHLDTIMTKSDITRKRSFHEDDPMEICHKKFCSSEFECSPQYSQKADMELEPDEDKECFVSVPDIVLSPAEPETSGLASLPPQDNHHLHVDLAEIGRGEVWIGNGAKEADRDVDELSDREYHFPDNYNLLQEMDMDYIMPDGEAAQHQPLLYDEINLSADLLDVYSNDL